MSNGIVPTSHNNASNGNGVDSTSQAGIDQSQLKRQNSTSTNGQTNSSSESIVNFESHIASPPLTPEIKSQINQLRSELQYESVYSDNLYIRRYCSDRILYQHLRARQFDLPKAKKLLISACEWRLATKPDELLATDPMIEHSAKSGQIIVSGVDRHSRPLLVMDSARLTPPPSTVHDELLQQVYFQMERVRQKLFEDSNIQQTQQIDGCQNNHTPPQSTDANGSIIPSSSSSTAAFEHQIEKFSAFIDFRRYGWKTAPSVKLSIEIARTLTERFVEHLGNAVLFQPPTYFNIIWTAVKPFLDSRTIEKIKFVNGDCTVGSKNDRLLTDVIGSDWRVKCNIPSVDAKGRETSVELPYDHEKFWPQVIAEQQAYKAKLANEYEFIEKSQQQQQQRQSNDLKSSNSMTISTVTPS